MKRNEHRLVVSDLQCLGKHGPAFAAWLRVNPWAKTPVRWLMDRAIDNLDKRHASA